MGSKLSDELVAVEFSGEESARFTRFAVLALDAGCGLSVDVLGREPLTSRVVRIAGRLVEARLDGYMRYVVVEDVGAVRVKNWVGGSNSTRSIAAQRVTYFLTDEDVAACLTQAEEQEVLLPGISQIDTELGQVSSEAVAIDNALTDRDLKALDAVLAFVEPGILDGPTKREAALGLRSFAELASDGISIQRRIERSILTALEQTSDRDTRIALVENLGYFGTEDSVPVLTEKAIDDADPHTRWAAIVALGRVPAAVEIQVLLDAFEVGSAPLEENWPTAATLLSIARRVEESELELVQPLLGRVVGGGEPTLARYACLALSRFTAVNDEVVSALMSLLGDSTAVASTRGYAALAISGLLRSLRDDQLEGVEALVESLHQEQVLGVEEPEDVWATEFLAELASLLEMEAVSAQLNRTLSDAYTDWRADYYYALASYAEAELQVRNEAPADAARNFQDAVRRLEGMEKAIRAEDGLHRATATFRLDITRARLRLHNLLEAWPDAMASQRLDTLIEEADEVAAIYRRYSSHETQLVGPKHLSERELEYVVSTCRLVELLRLLLDLDRATRAPGDDKSVEIIDRVHDAARVLAKLGDRFEASLARGLGGLVSSLQKRIGDLEAVLAVDAATLRTKQDAVRDELDAVRFAFGRANWPMPARACPVGGLGRGEVSVITEGLSGDGSRNEPLEYKLDGPVVVNVAIKIQEMAPGGSTRAAVRLRVGQEDHVEPVHAVEGPTTVSISLRVDVPQTQWQRAELSLEFTSRDCEQTAARSVFFLKRSGGAT